MVIKISSLLLLMLGYLFMYAQGPTLTQLNSAYSIGDEYILYPCDTTGVLQGVSGGNVTWDFSGLNMDSTTTSQQAVDPATTPYATDFSSSNISIVSNIYSYFQITSTYIDILGIENANFIVSYTNAERMMVFPVSYNSSTNDDFEGTIVYPSYTFNRTGTCSTTADAWGTLILPFATFNNLLRIKLVQDYTDVGPYTMVTHSDTYLWYDGVHHYPLLSMSFNTSEYLGITTKSKNVDISKYAFTASFTAPEMYSDDVLDIFPNPATSSFNINYNRNSTSEATVFIINSMGQTVKSIVNSEKNAGEYENISMDEFPSGLYYVKIIDENGEIIKKLLVN